jgi:hypothetical protein
MVTGDVEMLKMKRDPLLSEMDPWYWPAKSTARADLTEMLGLVAAVLKNARNWRQSMFKRSERQSQKLTGFSVRTASFQRNFTVAPRKFAISS